MTEVLQPRSSGPAVDPVELGQKVRRMYASVAENPDADYHFEVGRTLAEHLGYPPEVLDRIPAGAVESFAGVGYFFDLALLQKGESVLDLGSGSGMDAYFAAVQVGATGRVAGIDMTAQQLAKAERGRSTEDFAHVRFTRGRIEHVAVGDGSFDVVISNGVINLCTDKNQVFAEAARVLRPGGRLAVADIVTELSLPDSVVGNCDLWASCIGGAAQQEAYQRMIEAAGFRLVVMKRNDYRFLSPRAVSASARFGVRSVSLLAQRV